MPSRKQLYRQRRREEVRGNIPLEVLMQEKLNIVMRGQMATRDADGKIIGFEEVDIKDRLKELDDLVALGLPRNPADAAEMMDDDTVDAKEVEAVEHNPDILTTMSYEELRRLAYGSVDKDEETP